MSELCSYVLHVVGSGGGGYVAMISIHKLITVLQERQVWLILTYYLTAPSSRSVTTKYWAQECVALSEFQGPGPEPLRAPQSPSRPGGVRARASQGQRGSGPWLPLSGTWLRLTFDDGGVLALHYLQPFNDHRALLCLYPIIMH